MIYSSRYFAFALSMAVLLIGGCGKDEYPLASVTGKVTCNGNPVAGLVVVFSPTGDTTNQEFPGKAASGTTDENGEYELSTFKNQSGDGAIIGTHTVTLSYEDPEKTLDCEVPADLTKKVEDRSNVINFDL